MNLIGRNMATNSKKSNKSKYLKLGTLTVVIAAGVTVPIVMISRVDASDKAKPQIKPEVKPKDAYKGFIGTYNEEGNDPVHRPYNGNASNGDSPTVAMITDGGNPHDGAFNESAI